MAVGVAVFLGFSLNGAHAEDGFDVKDITVSELASGDVVSVTNIKTVSVTDGTAPFDANDDRGNDSSDHNGVVRSFDAVSYDFQYTLTPDNPYSYYKNAVVGFRFMLPYAEDKVTFDPEAMGWMEQSGEYKWVKEVKDVDGVSTQVLTAYRKLTPSSSTPTVVPGTATGKLVLKTRAAENGFEFAPKMETWVVSSGGSPKVTSFSFPSEKVSAKINLNVRLVAEPANRSGFYDFSAGNDTATHKAEGQVYGKLQRSFLVVEMRWPDRTKGLRGLEVPKGDISFKVDAKVQYRDDTVEANEHETEEVFQPYLYEMNNQFNRAWFSNIPDSVPLFSYTKVTDQHAKVVAGVDNVTRDKNGWHGVFTVKNYETTVYPFLGSNGTFNGLKKCQSWAKNSDCSEFQVAPISMVALQFVIPTTVNEKTITDFYGNVSQVGSLTVDDVELTAVSISGDEVSSTQSVESDDSSASNFAVRPDGSYIGHVLYSYENPNSFGYTDSGTTGYWADPQSHNGSDVVAKGTKFRITGGARMNIPSPEASPVFSQWLLKVDPHVVFDVPDDEVRKEPSSWYSWRSRLRYKLGFIEFMYAVKPDGSNWVDFNEQRSASFDDFNYYPTLGEAKKHGEVLGVLVTSSPVVDVYKTDFGGLLGYGAQLPVVLSDDAVIGSVLPVVEESRMWTRADLAEMSGLKGTSEVEEWLAFATPENAKKAISTVKPTYTYTGAPYTPATFDDEGNYKGGDTGDFARGDSLLVSGERPRVSVSVSQKSGSTAKSVFDLDRNERVVDWSITSAVKAPSVPDSYTTDYFITDKLPAGLTYIPGSAYVGGEYTENVPEAGHVDGGQPIEPVSIVENSDGTTTLQWIISGALAANDKTTVLRYSTSIGTPDNPDTDAKNNQQFAHEVSIKSRFYKTTPSRALGQVANASIRTSKLTQTSLATRALKLINDVSQPLSFSSMIANPSNDSKTPGLAVDILPYNGPDSKYSGDYTLTDVNVNQVEGVDMSDVTVYYTEDTSVRTRKPEEITPDYVSKWKKLEVVDGKAVLPANFKPTAFAVVVKSMAPKSRVNVVTEITPKGNSSGDVYTHYWTDGDNSVRAAVQTVNREVSGYVWEDENSNGIRDDGEKVISGVNVRLIDNYGRTVKSVLKQPLQTVTDSNGFYKLDNLPPGSGYRIRFTPNKLSDWAVLSVTQQNVAEAGEQKDSDAVGDSPTAPTEAVIELAAFPEIQDMKTTRYIDSFENLGLVRQRVSDFASPTMSEAKECGKLSTVNVPADSDKIVYTSKRVGDVVTVTAKAVNGYVIADGVKSEWTFKLTKKICPVTPVAPELEKAIQCGTVDKVHVPEDTAGVTYVRTQEGDSVTVVAKAKDGYRIADGVKSEWTFKLEKKVCPGVPVESTFAEGPECGDVGTVVVPEDSKEFTYVKTEKDGKVVVKAVPKDGYSVAEGAENEWEFELKQKICSVSTFEIPELEESKQCGVRDSVFVPEDTEEVTYKTKTDGNTVTVSVEANEGYSIPEGVTTEWTFELKEETCPATPPSEDKKTPAPAETNKPDTEDSTALAKTGLSVASPLVAALAFAAAGATFIFVSRRRKRN